MAIIEILKPKTVDEILDEMFSTDNAKEIVHGMYDEYDEQLILEFLLLMRKEMEYWYDESQDDVYDVAYSQGYDAGYLQASEDYDNA